ncbi:uncharacterized protein B0I36DRAFT_325796 [Microdochium trichocladiopsis]|uniref:Secreted protein n=1 Tax=Microdochium trichocladiopsis TaxID=1682393 RepID=A0A9P8Y5K5_9PEZI|nr:uncharacterized protein B0I36DRAFT_325796 [Microdochium trichocladiopsis]KAH7029445.1 hypothetical protein B0I36DRAFT_325796 [Microdochium trichocladiopsis]
MPCHCPCICLLVSGLAPYHMVDQPACRHRAGPRWARTLRRQIADCISISSPLAGEQQHNPGLPETQGATM